MEVMYVKVVIVEVAPLVLVGPETPCTIVTQ